MKTCSLLVPSKSIFGTLVFIGKSCGAFSRAFLSRCSFGNLSLGLGFFPADAALPRCPVGSSSSGLGFFRPMQLLPGAEAIQLQRYEVIQSSLVHAGNDSCISGSTDAALLPPLSGQTRCVLALLLFTASAKPHPDLLFMLSVQTYPQSKSRQNFKAFEKLKFTVLIGKHWQREHCVTFKTK